MAHPRESRFMPTVLGTEEGFPIGYPCQRHRIQETLGEGMLQDSWKRGCWHLMTSLAAQQVVCVLGDNRVARGQSGYQDVEVAVS